MIGLSSSFLEKLPYIQTMHHKRTNFPFAALSTFLVLAAAFAWAPRVRAQTPQPPAVPATAQAPATAPATGKPAEPPPEPPTEAERLIDEAIKKVAALKSVSADMAQDVVMLKQSFSIKGRYLKAPTSRIYLKLTVTGLPDSSGTMLQVCDGETLWDYQQVLGSQSYRKLSIKPVFEQLNSPEIDAKTRDMVMTQLGFTGPEALLIGLRKSVKFDQKEEDTLDGKPVWVLRGTWRNRNGLVGPDQRPLPPTGPLPAFVPSLATLYIGKKDGWPYKMVLVGKVPTILQDTRRIGPDGRPIGSRASIEKVEPSSIRLTYPNVQLDPTIKPEEFAFQAPPGASVEDNTETTLKILLQAIQMQAMQKRAEADKQSGPVLDQPIEIPKIPADPSPK